MFEQVGPGIYAVHNRWVEGKAGIVLGERAALAIDACGHPDEGQAMVEFIRSRGFEPHRLALTHGHGDHILGSEAFLGAEVYAHANTDAVIRSQLAGWARRSGETLEQTNKRVVWPTITFSNEMTIDLGGKRARMVWAPGHSMDGACVYVEEDRLLFGGDTVVTGIVPAIADGDSVELERTLRSLEELNAEALVSGHGPVVSGADAVREWLVFWAQYLSKIRVHVRTALGRGQAPEAVAASIPFQALIGDRLSSDRHSMPRRHQNTVEKVIREELDRVSLRVLRKSDEERVDQ